MRTPLGRVATILGVGLLALGASLHAAGCNDKKTHVPYVIPVAPTSLVSGNVALFYEVVGIKDETVQAAFEFSVDNGQIWTPATPAAGQPASPLVLAHPFGAPDFFFWNTLADLGPGFHRNVAVRANGFGGGSAGKGTSTPIFSVDNSDIFVTPAGGSAGTPRSNVFAAALPDGTVYVVGGVANNEPVPIGEVYDPYADSVVSQGGLSAPRFGFAGALLTNGRVLTVGGVEPVTSVAVATAEYFSRATAQTTVAGPLQVARANAALGALPEGGAVVAGGIASGAVVDQVELYDPVANSFSVVASNPLAAVQSPTATALADGRVLFAGGADASGRALPNALLYDPAKGIVPTSPLGAGRVGHRATLLSNGKVLIAGGMTDLENTQTLLATVEIFDPATLSFTFATSMKVPRAFHGQDLAGGRVLAVGGDTSTEPGGTAEEYDQDANLWRFTSFPPLARRLEAQVVATSAGRSVVAGGGAAIEVHHPLNLPPPEAWISLSTTPRPRADHTATLLFGGDVLLVGGTTGVTTATNTVERFHASTNVFNLPAATLDHFETVSSLNTARAGHAAAALQNGTVLVAGGLDANGNVLASLETYDPNVNAWTTRASTLAFPRTHAHAIQIATGDVLIVGGVDHSGAPVAATEIYHWGMDTIETGPSLAFPRVDDDVFTASNGLVFVAGGVDGAGNTVATVEVYNPYARTLSSSGVLASGRRGVALGQDSNSLDLVATGGVDASRTTRADFEGIDPTVPAILPGLTPLDHARAFHSLTRLQDRSLVLAGGMDGPIVTDAAGIYFQTQPFGFTVPSSATVRATLTPRLNSPRRLHTATPLDDGRVLVVGGLDQRGTVIAGAEFFLQPAQLYQPPTSSVQPLVPPAGPAFPASVVSFPTGDGFAFNPFLTPNYPPGTPTFP
jgi:hypothetical protein